MTTTTIPLKVFADPDALQQLKDGLANATACACPEELYQRMEDDDLRWDQLCERAIASIMPAVVSMLDGAIAAEWERAPIVIERRQSAGELVQA